MGYHPDFSEYYYVRRLVYYPFLTHIRRMGPQLNIGWLSIDHPYPKAPSAPEFIERLSDLTAYHFWPMRGFHVCEFCDTIVEHPRHGLLGAAEIRVRAPDCWYASPNLLLHYVEIHEYRPPDEFIDAAMTGPAPFTPQYEKDLDDLSLATQHGLNVRPRTPPP